MYTALSKSQPLAARGLGLSRPATIDLSVSGMSCASCVSRVEKVLAAVPGVDVATVNLATERASVHAQQGTSAEALLQAVKKAGYEAFVITDEADEADELAVRQDAEMASLTRDLIIALLLTLPVFVLDMGSHSIPAVHRFIGDSVGTEAYWYFQFVLTSLVLFVPGRRFFVQGLPALLRGAPDMNSLIAMGAGAAYVYSAVATFVPSALPAGTIHVYYEAAAVITTLILMGRFLEARAKGRSSEAIRRLMRLQPETAWVARDGKSVELPIDQVRAGDILEVRPGARIPVDGVVLEGSSFVDESMVSGEPIPMQKVPGSALTGGTVNQNGSLTLQATSVGANTVLAHIIRLVQQAQASKLPIQAAVDKITLWFVPGVLAVAALTFAGWLFFGPEPSLGLALVNAVAVLIIACPCAMGLATPTSIMVGTGRGAQMGILFRKGEALQSLRDTRIVALDKTGTLTEGRPRLTDLVLAPGFERDVLLARVAAVEARSEHPIARAIVAAAEEKGLSIAPLTEFQSEAGYGVRARVDGDAVHVGADRYMEKLGLDTLIFAAEAARLADEGKTPLYAAVDGRLGAMIAVSDPVKETTESGIRELHRLGLKVAMITGDHRRTAQAVALRLGIDEVVAEVLPQGKLAAVQRLKAEYGLLAFVGDGINDAPALAEADVGLAIGTGTDIAMEAADVVLMSGDLNGVAKAIALSRATISNIRQNLFWAFAYNTALIPIAAGVLYPINGSLLSPMLAAGAMALSSVFVVLNALRLRRFSPGTTA